MEGARVIIFEDDSSWQDIVTEDLTYAGHSVVAKAQSMHAATELVERLDENAADVAIVDGNLGNSSTGADGRAIVGLLRAKFPNIYAIGFSSTDDVEGANAQAHKLGEADELTSIIAKI